MALNMADLKLPAKKEHDEKCDVEDIMDDIENRILAISLNDIDDSFMLSRIGEDNQLFSDDEPKDTAEQYQMHYNYLLSNDEDGVGVEAR